MKKQDKIKDFNDINANHAPANYLFYKTLEFVVFYYVKFSSSGFPKIYEAIKINKNLHVQLKWCGDSVLLPQWFVKGKDPKLTNMSMLVNFHSYLQTLQDSCNTFIEEMKSRQHYKAKGQTPYSSQFLRFALFLHYSSAQAYQIVFEHLPFPSMCLLQKLRKGKVDAKKAAKSTEEKRCNK